MLRRGAGGLRRTLVTAWTSWRRVIARVALHVPPRLQPSGVRRVLLPSAVRELNTADLRRLVDGLSRATGASGVSEEVGSAAGNGTGDGAGDDTTGTSDNPGIDSDKPADVALVRALLPAIHASPFASDRLADACAGPQNGSPKGAPSGLRRAVAERLLMHGRAELAWRVVDTVPRARLGVAEVRRLIRLLSDADALESLADEAAMPGRPRVRQALRAEAMIARGRIAFADDGEGCDLAAARSWFDHAEAAWPTSASATWIARAALASDDIADAGRWVAIALERPPRDREALLTAADLQIAAGDPAEAVEALAIVAADPATNPWQLDSVWRRLRDRVDTSDDEVAGAARKVEETVAERLGASGGPMGAAAWAVTLWWSGDRAEAEERMAPMWSATDAVSLRAYAFYLGRTGRSPEAYEVLGRMSIFMRGEQACVDLVAALRADGHARLAQQALDRAADVFPQLRDQLDLSGD